MDLKKKYAEVKTKLNENASEIIAVTSTVSGFVALAIAYHYKQKLAVESAHHKECHGYAQWVVGRAEEGGEKKLIWREGATTYISEMDTEE